MISLKGIEKIFRNRSQTVTALKNIHLDIEPGEIFGIIGRAGAGKTTLARCINLLERPEAGIVKVGKCVLTSLNEEGLRFARQKIGYLPKHPELLASRTVQGNIALPLEFTKTSKSEIQQITTAVMQSLELTDKAGHYPQALTPNQRQKVALARLLVLKPTVLICDDPQMDLKSSHNFAQFLCELNEELKITILYMTQEIETLKPLCSRAAVLHQGEIIEQNNLIQLFANPTSTITKELIKSSARLELPIALRKRLRGTPGDSMNPVLRITFLGTTHQESLIANAIQQFGLTLHIIQAHMETINHQVMGIMVAEVGGAMEGLVKSVEYLETKGLFIEVLGYVPRVA